MLLLFCMFSIPLLVSSCHPSCKAQWIGNNICNLECMNKACGFDSGDCLVECLWSGCSKNSPDGVCDDSCNSNVCGFDFGDCGYCNEECTEAMYLDAVCDEVCNTPACLLDNYSCVSCI